MRINITYTINSKYVKYLYVSLLSLLESNSHNDLCVHIISYDLTEHDVNTISSLIKDYDKDVVFYSVDDLDTFLPYVNSGYSKEVYLRLFMPWKLMAVDKTLFVDADVIFRKDIHELFEYDLSSYAMMACPGYDCTADLLMQRNDIFKRTNDYNYYNAGVMLWNLDFIRENYELSDFINVIDVFGDKLWFNDQDIINYLLYKNILSVDNKYNLLVGGIVDRDDFDELVNSASIVHYAGCNPWKIGKINRSDIELWWEYARRTHFYSEILEESIVYISNAQYEIKKKSEVAEAFTNYRLRGNKIIEKRALKGVNKIAIYGAGKWTRVLLEELKDDIDRVTCIIDKNARGNMYGINISGISEISRVNDADVLIVTPLLFYDEIVESIKDDVTVPIISLKDIFDRI